MIQTSGCRQHLHAEAARPQLLATAAHPFNRLWSLHYQRIPFHRKALGSSEGRQHSDHYAKEILPEAAQAVWQQEQQRYLPAGHIEHAGLPQQQQQQQHWVVHFLQSPRLAGAFMAAALLALLPGIGRQSAALAATLPPPCQTTTTDDKSSISSRAGRSSSMTFPYPVQDMMQLSNAAVCQHHQTLTDAALTSTGERHSSSSSSSSNWKSATASTLSPSSHSSSSNILQQATFPATGSSGSTAVNPASSSSTAVNPASSSSTGGPNSSSSSSSHTPAAANTNALDELLAYERAAVNLFAAALPSVVNITHMRAMQNFYTLDIHHMAVGQGSGFIWDKLGHVVTNYHVIKGAAEVKVTLYDHSSCTARVVGWDERKDIAVLKLALPRGRLEALNPVSLGNSSSLRVGQSCFAIGNPFGLDHTLTQGIVSGLGRELSTGLSAIKNVIQTDAAINPGNSGGVLLNSQGAVIGVNLGILDPNGKGSFSGVGFAIPIDTVKGLVEQILAHGRVRRPSLGISIAPEQVLAQLGAEGVLVLEVPAGTPAAAAGLRATYRDVFGDIVLGDIIVGMDTRPIRSTADLIAALDERRSGDKVRCDVLRDGKRLSMTVALGERGASCE